MALQQPRSTPKTAKLVLPVWGYRYVRQFLTYGLPTLLAPGNVPAVVAALPTEFLILASADDEEYIREHANFKRLAAVCKTEIRPIDHLITDGNYSTTITLAYTEVVHAVGAAMVDTCFFFLVSDYIMADGSLASAMRRMLGGASAVTVGNFQVADEEAVPWLQDKLATNKHSLALQPREMMRWALNNLHPTTLANTVNIPFSHNSHTNRLFWRVDGDTILGRFYLMHMLCVRPEVTDFIIGSSCDYSFVPEMCPSGNVEAITDSDEYLVIEMQPRHHESAFLRPGPLKTRALAKSLSEWTTSVHRENVNNSLIFHADELPPTLRHSIDEADAFLASVARHLKCKPAPHRGHPYWRGALAAYYDATGRKLSEDEWRYALGLPASNDLVTQWLLYHAKYALMGQPPHVLPWHPAWPDFKTVLGELASFFADHHQRLLMLSSAPTAFTVALADSGERVYRMRCNPFLQNPPERYAPMRGKFDLCLLELTETEMRFGADLVDRIVPLMKRGGRIIVFVSNRRHIDNGGEFGQSVVFHSARFIRSGVLPSEIYFVPANRARWIARRGMFELRLLLNKGPWFSVPLAVLGGGLLFALSLIGNLDALRATQRVAARGHKSSFVMRLSVDAPEHTNVKMLTRFGRTGSGAHRSEIAAKALALPALGATEETRETEYNRHVELRDTIGLASLGLITNRVWYDDPRRLTILLVRYNFVAKTLSGCRNVGEVGCGDAFGTRLVLQEVGDVTVYDFDPLFIEDIRGRQDARWPLKAEIHDIVETRLPRKHDALFSLNVIERLAPEDEHAYLTHLAGSVAENGLIIIGARSLESQASPLSKPGRINCKTSKQLEFLLKKYFAHVFMFSMTDEVIHSGFSPMADYSFALCAEAKWEAGELRRKQSPLFEICVSPSGSGFYVRVTHPNTEPQRIDGFATVGEAGRWISNLAQDWLRAGRPNSY